MKMVTKHPELTKNLRGGLVFLDDHMSRSRRNKKHLQETFGQFAPEAAEAAGVKTRRDTGVKQTETTCLQWWTSNVLQKFLLLYEDVWRRNKVSRWLYFSLLKPADKNKKKALFGSMWAKRLVVASLGSDPSCAHRKWMKTANVSKRRN